jgi:hypothetical protein
MPFRSGVRSDPTAKPRCYYPWHRAHYQELSESWATQRARHQMGDVSREDAAQIALIEGDAVI